MIEYNNYFIIENKDNLKYFGGYVLAITNNKIVNIKDEFKNIKDIIFNDDEIQILKIKAPKKTNFVDNIIYYIKQKNKEIRNGS